MDARQRSYASIGTLGIILASVTIAWGQQPWAQQAQGQQGSPAPYNPALRYAPAPNAPQANPSQAGVSQQGAAQQSAYASPQNSAWQPQPQAGMQPAPAGPAPAYAPVNPAANADPQTSGYRAPYSEQNNFQMEVLHGSSNGQTTGNGQNVGQQNPNLPAPGAATESTAQRLFVGDQPAANNPAAQEPADESTEKTAADAPLSAHSEKDEALAALVKKSMAEVEAAEKLEEAKKTEYLDYLKKAAKWLESKSQYRQKAVEFETEVSGAPKMLEELKARMAQQPAAAGPEYADDASLTQLEQGLTAAQENLKAAREKLTQREQEANSKLRADRKAELTKLKETNAKRLEEAQKELKSFEAADASDRGIAARKLELEARIGSIELQQKLHDAERKRLDALADVFPIRRDLAQREVSSGEKLVAAWQEVVTRFRKRESERQAAEARRIASEAHPVVRDVALRNAALAESRSLLTKHMEEVTGYLESVGGQLKKIDTDFQDVKNKVEVYGMTPTVGLLLRNRRQHLPPLEKHRERLGYCERNMQEAQVSLLELETERVEVGDIDQSIDQTIKDLGSVATQFEPGYLDSMVRDLYQGRREYLDSLLQDYHTYHDNLANLELKTRELLEQTEEYRAFIDENVLWIPSAPALQVSDASDSFQAAISFADPKRFGRLLNDVTNNFRSRPLISLALLAVIGLAFFSRGYLIRRLSHHGHQVSQSDALIVFPTIWAFCETLLLAGRWPIIFGATAAWLYQIENPAQWTLGVTHGLIAVVSLQFVLEAFRQTCREGGLAELHFGWPKESLPTLFRSLHVFACLALPLLMAELLIFNHAGGQWRDSLGRVILLAYLALGAFGMHFLLSPRNGPIPHAFAQSTGSWIYRLRHLWYALGVGFPIALFVLLCMGYTYSAHELLSRLWMAGCTLLALVLTQELSSRALAVAWNRMNLRRLKEHRRKPRKRSEGDSLDDLANQEQIEIKDGDRQLRQFIQYAAAMAFLVCNWFVWSDVLPALQVFDRVALWDTTVMVTQEVQQADGTMVAERVPKEVPITLSNLFLSIAVLAVTYSAAKTLPSLLEISVLHRIPMDNGARHAIVIVSRYIVSVLGFVLACNLLGIRWASVQWLAAAMTVGLGFGLQEIFANLVSGLIILFERPIRIGDLVTVGGTTGKISRMQIRATTITDFDRRELIVPNKKFITDDVVNWTLSDPITRFVVPVGISYECDPDKAQQILLDLAHKHPLVLQEPEPSAVFTGFGNSTLNLELRVFLGKRDDFVKLQHEMNLAVGRAFKEAGIEIAFPQQDIHIRSIKASLDIKNSTLLEGSVADEEKESKAA